jgi:peptide/nickel transport system substrate-binding protein
MKRLKFLVAVGVLFLISLLLTSSSQAAATGAPKGQAVWVSYSGAWEFKSIDPHTIIGSSAMEPCHMLFDHLVDKDLNGQFIPGLAKTWEISPDGLKITFNLTKEAKFWDGTPVTAKDVKFSIERCMRPELKFVKGSEFRRSIDRIEIVDDYKVTVYFKMLCPGFLDTAFEYLGIVPKHYVEKVGDAGFADKPMGSGPFRLIEFKPDKQLKAEANMQYHRKIPDVKTMTIMTVQEPATRLAMLKTGEADMIHMSAEHVPEVRKDPKMKLIWTKQTYLMTLIFYDMGFPNEPSPFKDVRVRMATSYAINRSTLAKLMNNTVEPWGSFLAPYHPGYDPSRKPDPYDPKKAKELLAAAGYPNGFNTVFTGHAAFATLWQALVAQLAEVGIKCRLDIPEFGIWSRSSMEGKFRGIGYGAGPWWAGRAPGVALESHTCTSWAPEGRPYPETREAIDKIYRADLKGEKAVAKAARAADDLLLDKMVLRRPLFAVNVVYAAGPKVEYYENHPGQVRAMRFNYLKLK